MDEIPAIERPQFEFTAAVRDLSRAWDLAIGSDVPTGPAEGVTSPSPASRHILCRRFNLCFNHPMNYWLVKSEPAAYAWAQFAKDGKTAWTGVRNFAARLNLRAMKKGDLVCFYHSVTDKQIIGLARVTKEFYPDPTATEGDWSAWSWRR